MEYARLKKVKQAGDKYTIIATTDDIDRDGDIVMPGGVSNLDKYLKDNPVILFGHNYTQPPVGKAVDGRVGDKSIELDIEFADTEFGREVKYLYDNGFMNSFSIGFIPKDSKVVEGQWYWTEWELLEVSAVPVPANSAANIIRSVESRGVSVPCFKGLYQNDLEGEREKKALFEEVQQKRAELKNLDNKIENLYRSMKLGQFRE